MRDETTLESQNGPQTNKNTGPSSHSSAHVYTSPREKALDVLDRGMKELVQIIEADASSER